MTDMTEHAKGSHSGNYIGNLFLNQFSGKSPFSLMSSDPKSTDKNYLKNFVSMLRNSANFMCISVEASHLPEEIEGTYFGVPQMGV